MTHAPAFPVSNRMRRLLKFLVAVFMTSAATLLHAQNLPEPDRFAGHGKLVAETHAASLKLREASLRGTIARKEGWPPGTWGDNLWCLAALCLNEKTDEANARLLKSANKFIESKPKKLAETSPEDPGKLPWTFFSITDYLRILYLFHAKSPHFPGRLKPETEAAIKESLWLWVRGESRLAEAGPDGQFLLLGTENHDLNRRPPYYLITAFLNADPILLDKRAFPAVRPFGIRNRVLGELKTAGPDGGPQSIVPDSALINYAWRSPLYQLGSTLQNPTLEYSGISQQKRWCGLLFHDPSSHPVGSIDTVIEKTGGGRPQHSFWSVQHENVLILQRIARKLQTDLRNWQESVLKSLTGADYRDEK